MSSHLLCYSQVEYCFTLTGPAKTSAPGEGELIVPLGMQRIRSPAAKVEEW